MPAAPPARHRDEPPPLPADSFHRYLRIQDLQSLRHLEFAPRGIVRGLYAGRHDSPQRGHSVEFNDYREYVPGDEIGNIDWKVYGRSDRLYLKLFEHQTDMVVYMMVDGSASMAYRGFAAQSPRGRAGRFGRTGDGNPPAPSKYDQACRMAAALSFLVIKQQDRVSFSVSRNGLNPHLPPHGSFPHLRRVLSAMDEAPPAGRASLAESLEELFRRTRRKGMLILFSDLLEDEEPILRQLGHFLQRGNDIILFHILHPDELEFPDLGEALLTDSETRADLRLNADEARAGYQANLGRYLREWRSACRGRGIDYNLVSSAQSYHEALRTYLYRRSAMR